MEAGNGTYGAWDTGPGSLPSGEGALAVSRRVAPSTWLSHITFMALVRKKATTIALEPAMDALLTRAAEERGTSRSEFIRQHLALVLEQFRPHPKPKVAGIIRRKLPERGDEAELYADRRR